jgi:Kef-type K+ transport system membrane component KefB
MNWTILVIAFCLAILAGAISVTTLASMRPQWSNRRQALAAAAVLPAITLFVAAIGIVAVLVTGPGDGENMQDLAVAVVAAMGGIFALLAFVGGLLGAKIRQRGANR